MFPRRSAFLPCLAAAFAASALPGAWCGGRAWVDFEPDARAKEISRLEGATWIAGGAGWSARLRRLDEGERRAFFEREGGAPADPFASRPDAAPAFLTFLLEVDNRTGSTVIAHPQSWWLVTNRNEVLSPTGLESLRATYGMVGHELPPAYEHSRRALLEGTLTLGPGESAAGLLVYRMVKPSAKSFRVDFRFILPNGEPATLTAAYRRAKKKKTP